MRTRTVDCLGYRFTVKAEITADTQLWTFMDERGQRFFVVCTALGLAQFKDSGYLPADGGMLARVDWNLVGEPAKLEAAKRSDWAKVRRVGREWNFV